MPSKYATHCVNGHEFTSANTRWVKNGRRRRCRTCSNWGDKLYDTYKRKPRVKVATAEATKAPDKRL